MWGRRDRGIWSGALHVDKHDATAMLRQYTHTTQTPHMSHVFQVLLDD
jgi:hypothetical protein